MRLWRAKWLMLLIFLVIAGAGAFAATQMPTRFTATSRLYVALGDEHIYRPIAGGEGAGLAPQLEELVQAELELLRSPIVAERALSRFPLQRVFPRLAADRDQALRDADPAARDLVDETYFQAGVDRLQAQFTVTAARRSAVIAASFPNSDRETAAEVLNALVGAYFTYRTEVFQDQTPGALSDQRNVFQARLAESDAQIQAFLDENGIGDFAAEQQTAQALYQSLSQSLLEAEATLGATRSELASVRRQLAALNPDIDLYIEDTSQQTLIDLRMQREGLLSYYPGDAGVVTAIDARIAQAEAFLAEKDRPPGTVRRGPNPVYQDLQTAAGGLAGRAAFQAEQAAGLRRQLDALTGRRRALAELSPQWRALQRERRLLEEKVLALSERELDARTRADLAHLKADTIRILEPARAPAEGSSHTLPIAVATGLAAIIIALFAGVMHAMSRPGLATASAVERASGLPVVAAIPNRRP